MTPTGLLILPLSALHAAANLRRLQQSLQERSDKSFVKSILALRVPSPTCKHAILRKTASGKAVMLLM